MLEVFKGKNESGKEEILIRKSFLILLYIIFKIIFFGIIVGGLVWGVFIMKSNYAENGLGVMVRIGLIIVGLLVYFWVAIVVWLIRYCYDVYLVTEDKIYNFQMGIFFWENIDSIELYRIQEIRAKCETFFHIIFNVGHLVLVEQNYEERVISRIDKPKVKLIMIGKIKDDIIKNRSK